jgi:hypothetical protein
VKSAAINVGVQVSMLYADLHFFEYMPESGIAGSYGSLFFSFLKNLHPDFYSDSTNLYSYQQYIRVSLFQMLTSICCFLDDSHSDLSKMESQCFDLQFLYV